MTWAFYSALALFLYFVVGVAVGVYLMESRGLRVALLWSVLVGSVFPLFAGWVVL